MSFYQFSLPKINMLPVLGTIFKKMRGRSLGAAAVLMLSATVVLAGGYRKYAIDYYDKSSGLYFKGVMSGKAASGFLSKVSRGVHVSNILIYDPTKEKTSLLFPKQDAERVITMFFQEEGYYTRRQAMFKGSDVEPRLKLLDFHNYGGVNVHNNGSAKKREIRNHMLVGLWFAKRNETEIYSSKKDGTGLKRIFTLIKGSSWHIDLKAMKIRFLTPDKKLGYKVTSFDW